MMNNVSGYPYQSPRSPLGKLLAIGIAALGLPIFLLYICLVGRLLARHLETLYNCLYNRLLCCTLTEDRKRRVPAWVCLLILLVYLLCGTILMSHLHQADMIDSLLYTFSLLVTIGVTLDSDTDLLCVLLTSLYIILGAALVSMCGFCLSRDLASLLQCMTRPS